jgi:hypothetical protein
MTALASVPEQLAHHVQAVSDRRVHNFGSCVAYVDNGSGVIVAYPPAGPPRPCTGSEPWTSVPEPLGHDLAQSLDAIAPHCASLTVLAPFTPTQAPPWARHHTDAYWELPLPCDPLSRKLDNMIRRAARDIGIGEEAWGQEHEALVRRYLAWPQLAAGTRAIFSRVGRYAAIGEGVRTLSARRRDGRLAACCIGDFTGLSTAFYMYAFRHPDAPPGTADLLLHRLVRDAEASGHAQVNLGLGISPGVAAFKRKWPAVPSLPCVETTWECRSGQRDAGRRTPEIPKVPGGKGLSGMLRRILGTAKDRNA